jgi:glucosamine kinase
MAVRGEHRVRAGGWGPLLGDAGNGYSIGCAVLAAVTRGEDGRGQTTPLKVCYK